MDLRHLHHFAAVAETCHFGRAAQRFSVAPAALSQSIRSLEEEIGVTLLARTTRRVSLTPAGEFFQKETAHLLGRLDEAVAGARRFAEGKAGLLRIGVSGTTAFAHLPRIVRTLTAELPDVELALHADMLTPAQCDALRDGRLDIGVLRPPAVGAGIATTPFLTEPLVLALPVTHPLAHVESLSLRDFERDSWVMYSDQHSLVNDAITAACRAAGFVLRRDHAASGTSVILALVASGLGVAAVPSSVRTYPLDGVVFREIPEAGSIGLVVAYREGETPPLVQAALDLLMASR